MSLKSLRHYLLVSVMFGMECCQTCELVLMVVNLQTLGVPMALTSLPLVLSASLSLVLIPVIGVLNDRCFRTSRQKAFSLLFVNFIQFMGASLIVLANTLKLVGQMESNGSKHDHGSFNKTTIAPFLFLLDNNNLGNTVLNSSLLLSSDGTSTNSNISENNLFDNMSLFSDDLSSKYNISSSSSSSSNGRNSNNPSIFNNDNETTDAYHKNLHASLTETVREILESFSSADTKTTTTATSKNDDIISSSINQEFSSPVIRQSNSTLYLTEESSYKYNLGTNSLIAMLGYVLNDSGYDTGSCFLKTFALTSTSQRDHSNIIVKAIVVASMGGILVTLLGAIGVGKFIAAGTELDVHALNAIFIFGVSAIMLLGTMILTNLTGLCWPVYPEGEGGGTEEGGEQERDNILPNADSVSFHKRFKYDSTAVTEDGTTSLTSSTITIASSVAGEGDNRFMLSYGPSHNHNNHHHNRFMNSYSYANNSCSTTPYDLSNSISKEVMEHIWQLSHSGAHSFVDESLTSLPYYGHSNSHSHSHGTHTPSQTLATQFHQSPFSSNNPAGLAHQPQTHQQRLDLRLGIHRKEEVGDNNDDAASSKQSSSGVIGSCFQRLAKFVTSNRLMINLCFATFFGLVGLISFNQFSVNFVAVSIFHGNPHAQPGSDSYEDYLTGIQAGSTGLLAFYSSFVVGTTLQTFIIHKIGWWKQTAIVFTAYVFANSICVVVEIEQVYYATACVNGQMRAIMFTLPYILVCRILSNKEQEDPFKQSNPTVMAKSRERDITIVSALLPIATCFVSALVGPLIDVTNDAGVPLIATAIGATISIVLFSLVRKY